MDAGLGENKFTLLVAKPTYMIKVKMGDDEISHIARCKFEFLLQDVEQGVVVTLNREALREFSIVIIANTGIN